MSTDKKAGLTGILVMFSVLALSLPVYCQAFTTPAMGAIMQAFPDVPTTTIKMVSSLPSLMQVIFPFICAALEQFLSRRKLVGIGFGLATIGGVISGMAPNFTMVLVGRAVYGAGMGFIAPLAVALIAQLYPGEKRAKVMGYRNTFAALFGIVFSQLGGIVAGFNWRISFYAYLILVPIAIYVLIVIPNAPPKLKDKSQKEEKLRFPIQSIIWVAAYMCWRAFTQQLTANLSMVMTERAVTTPAVIGTVATMVTVATVLAGMAYGWTPKKVRRYAMPIAMFMLGLGMFIMYQFGNGTSSVPLYFIGTLISGFGITYFGVDYNVRLAGSCSPALITAVIALSNTVSGFSQTISPIVLDFASSIFKFEGTGGGWMVTACVTIPAAIIAAIAITVVCLRKKQTPQDATLS